ncbi:MAG: PAS domain S-box protein [Cyanobacteria bacterium SZAS LIN-3]|nr:PAS domain S-box protein [Cyanobacteria bacterium SZAS LIN-3]MBS2005435.1 PAS domain S-box protein [Cyanobacteria bacterium SZAS TMP-1]
MFVVPLELGYASAMTIKLTHKAIIIVAVPLAFELVFVGWLAFLLRNADAEALAAARSREMVAGAATLLKLVQEAGITLYSFKNTASPELIDLYRSYPPKLRGQMDILYGLARGHADEIAELNQISALVDEANTLGGNLATGMARGENYDKGDNLLSARTGILSLTSRLQRHLHVLADIERRYGGHSFETEERARNQLWMALTVGLLVNLTVALGLLAAFIRTVSSRLQALLDNIDRLAANQPLNPRLSGGDELALLDSTFHRMADALEDASAKERAIAENALDAIVTLDEDLKLLSLNPATLAVFAFSRGQLLGRRLVDLVVEEEKQAVRQAFMDAKQRSAEGLTTFVECRMVRKDGRPAEMRWSVNWSEKERTYFCVGQDVSERKQIERVKQEFISMMSHDLRSPLTAVQASLSMLVAGLDGPLPPQSTRRLVDSERNIDYVISLINSLMDVERLDQDNLTVHRGRTSLAQIIDRSLDAVRPIAERQHVELKSDYRDMDLIADNNRIIQVLINLVSNALKFTEPGGTVSVSGRFDGKTDFVEIAVTDTGRGIPPEKLKSIFGRYEQVEESDAAVQGGAGLGLAICKRIVEEHGGSIGVESTPGRGSRFWFTLPT